MTPATQGLSRWLPRSLFGRLVLVLAGGLLVAQLLSAAINLAERDRLLLTYAGMRQVQRIADTVRLLDSLDSAERARVIAVLGVPPLVPSLHDAPSAPGIGEGGSAGTQWTMFAHMLRTGFGDGRALRVTSAAPTVPAALKPGLRRVA